MGAVAGRAIGDITSSECKHRFSSVPFRLWTGATKVLSAWPDTGTPARSRDSSLLPHHVNGILLAFQANILQQVRVELQD
jgi:hypothetical protein